MDSFTLDLLYYVFLVKNKNLFTAIRIVCSLYCKIKDSFVLILNKKQNLLIFSF